MCTCNTIFYILLILGIKIIQQILKTEDMVAGIVRDRINNNNSSCTDMNSIYILFS